mmetsp:Transcript_97183/g.253448  ORF Transcript_97183/g.253448 Transcript_97183/m.253448 type:complete len:86 (-) Transcript_97183:53-310(-)
MLCHVLMPLWCEMYKAWADFGSCMCARAEWRTLLGQEGPGCRCWAGVFLGAGRGSGGGAQGFLIRFWTLRLDVYIDAEVAASESF